MRASAARREPHARAEQDGTKCRPARFGRAAERQPVLSIVDKSVAVNQRQPVLKQTGEFAGVVLVHRTEALQDVEVDAAVVRLRVVWLLVGAVVVDGDVLFDDYARQEHVRDSYPDWFRRWRVAWAWAVLLGVGM
jgi:hypothetical protein